MHTTMHRTFMKKGRILMFNLFSIAASIIGAEYISLAEKQACFLASAIQELPEDERKALDSGLSELGESAKATRHNAIVKLRANAKLSAILSLSTASYSDLVDTLTEAIMKGEPVEERQTSSNTTYGCLLQKLFSSKPAAKDDLENPVYSDALAVMTAKDDSVLLKLNTSYLPGPSCISKLAKAGIVTNADLIRWNNSPTRKLNTISGIGKKQAEKIQKYIEFWFSPERQKLLSSNTPL